MFFAQNMFFVVSETTLQEGMSFMKLIQEVSKLYDIVWDVVTTILDVMMILMVQKIDLASILFDRDFFNFNIWHIHQLQFQMIDKHKNQ